MPSDMRGAGNDSGKKKIDKLSPKNEELWKDFNKGHHECNEQGESA